MGERLNMKIDALKMATKSLTNSLNSTISGWQEEMSNAPAMGNGSVRRTLGSPLQSSQRSASSQDVLESPSMGVAGNGALRRLPEACFRDAADPYQCPKVDTLEERLTIAEAAVDSLPESPKKVEMLRARLLQAEAAVADSMPAVILSNEAMRTGNGKQAEDTNGQKDVRRVVFTEDLVEDSSAAGSPTMRPAIAEQVAVTRAKVGKVSDSLTEARSELLMVKEVYGKLDLAVDPQWLAKVAELQAKAEAELGIAEEALDGVVVPSSSGASLSRRNSSTSNKDMKRRHSSSTFSKDCQKGFLQAVLKQIMPSLPCSCANQPSRQCTKNV